MQRGLALQASGHAAEFFQACGNGFQRDVQRDCSSSCSQRVARVVRTGNLQVRGEHSLRRGHVKPQAITVWLPRAAHIGLRIQAKFEQLMRAR